MNRPFRGRDAEPGALQQAFDQLRYMRTEQTAPVVAR